MAARRGFSRSLRSTPSLNIAWSPLFFKLRRPDWALVELVSFWLSVLALVIAVGAISSIAGGAARALSRLGHVRGLSELAHGRTEQAIRQARAHPRGVRGKLEAIAVSLLMGGRLTQSSRFSRSKAWLSLHGAS